MEHLVRCAERVGRALEEAIETSFGEGGDVFVSLTDDDEKVKIVQDIIPRINPSSLIIIATLMNAMIVGSVLERKEVADVEDIKGALESTRTLLLALESVEETVLQAKSIVVSQELELMGLAAEKGAM